MHQLEKILPEKTHCFGRLWREHPALIRNLLNVADVMILNNFTSVYGVDAVAA